MRSEQVRTLNTLRRSAQFLTDNSATLGNINTTGARAALDSSITALATFFASQTAGKDNAIGESARKASLRSTLRETYMRPIAMIAKQQLSTNPAFKSLTMPPTNAPVAALVAKAYAMAEAASANSAVFIAAGLDANFAAELTAAADAVSASVDARAASVGRRASATGGLAAAEKAGMSALRVISSLVVPRMAGNAALLAEWKGLIKVSAKLGPVAGTTVPVTPVSPATPVAQPSPSTLVVPAPTVTPAAPASGTPSSPAPSGKEASPVA